MSDHLATPDVPQAYGTRSASADPEGRDGTRKPFVSVVRGGANFLTLVGAITIAIGWAMHWPPYILGRVALLTLTAFIVSFVAILIENRRHPEDDDP